MDSLLVADAVIMNTLVLHES